LRYQSEHVERLNTVGAHPECTRHDVAKYRDIADGWPQLNVLGFLQTTTETAMPFVCENVECRAVLARGQVRAISENDGWFFYCPDCKARNELHNVGHPGGPLEFAQPERPDLPHKVIATARPLEDGQYAAQLRIQRALLTKGTYAVEERWDQLGTFPNAQDAIAHAKSVAVERLA
jgi:hypothetical protein